MNKITNSDILGKGIRDLPDVPGLEDGTMQSKFDELAIDVIIPAHNDLIDDLAASTAAAQIGSTNGGVQAELNYLRGEASGKPDYSEVLVKGGETAFTPAAQYDPATKKYVDDTVVNIGAGDMAKSVYDSDNDGAIDLAAGGTGAKTAASARSNLGLGTLATLSTAPLANGGTGATTAAAARTNLGVKAMQVVDSLPATLAANTIYFVY